jgi:hypothetical protein
VCVVASAEGDLLDAEVIRDEPVAASLPRVLERMLAAVDTAVVVVTGPGTYTGVRAGMAAALGIADARNLPLYGVGALEVVARGDPEANGEDWVVSDAGRGALYLARVRDAAHATRVRADSFDGGGLRLVSGESDAGAGVPGGEFDAGGARVLSSDVIDLAVVVMIDPALALARAVPLALSRAALDREGLTAVYVD